MESLACEARRGLRAALTPGPSTPSLTGLSSGLVSETCPPSPTLTLMRSGCRQSCPTDSPERGRLFIGIFFPYVRHCCQPYRVNQARWRIRGHSWLAKGCGGLFPQLAYLLDSLAGIGDGDVRLDLVDSPGDFAVFHTWVLSLYEKRHREALEGTHHLGG